MDEANSRSEADIRNIKMSNPEHIARADPKSLYFVVSGTVALLLCGCSLEKL